MINPTIKSINRCISYTKECGIPVEIHLVLDQPDERTLNIAVRELGNEGKLHQVDFGDKSKARNFGVEQSNGEYVAFLDSGNLWCRSWLVDAYLLCSTQSVETIIHPEFSVSFGGSEAVTLKHMDMDDSCFEAESLLHQNYWTVYSFGKTTTFRKHPFIPSSLQEGFGYPEWSWNRATVRKGVRHKVASLTSHYTRISAVKTSEQAGGLTRHVIPRLHDVYLQPAIAGV